MNHDLSNLKPDVRHLNDMREVLADRDFAKNSPDIDLYYMYRGLEEKDTIRYDETIIPAKMLGSEFVKTKGHYHVGAYQEIYTVLDGEAIFLMEKRDENNDIKDVYAVSAKKGDFVIIPSFYGHVTINPSKNKDLKTANWSFSGYKSDYSVYEKMQGACYYYTTNSWVKNENYKLVPPLRQEKPVKSLPKDLSFLKNG